MDLFSQMQILAYFTYIKKASICFCGCQVCITYIYRCTHIERDCVHSDGGKRRNNNNIVPLPSLFSMKVILSHSTLLRKNPEEMINLGPDEEVLPEIKF